MRASDPAVAGRMAEDDDLRPWFRWAVVAFGAAISGRDTLAE